MNGYLDAVGGLADLGRSVLMEECARDRAGRPVMRIERIGQDYQERLEKGLSRKAIESAGYSGTGYTNQDTADGMNLQPQDRITPLTDETQNQQAALAWMLETKVPIRNVKTLTYDLVRRTSRPWDPDPSLAISESGIGQTFSHAYLQAQSHIKLRSARVDATFLSGYIARSYNLPDPYADKLRMINEDRPKFQNAAYWADEADCSVIGAVSGGEQLQFDGIVRKLRDAAATYSHVRIDCAGHHITADYVKQAMAAMVEHGFTPSLGVGVQDLDIVKNVIGLIPQVQWNYMTADSKANWGNYYNTEGRELGSGARWKGVVATDEGNPRFIRDFYLPKIFNNNRLPTAAASPTGCSVPAPIDVAIANVAISSGAGVPTAEYFSDAGHANTGKNFYYWVRLRGPSGASRCVAATGPAFVTSATGQVTAITIDVRGLTLTGTSGAWCAEVWRHTTASPALVNNVCTTGGYIPKRFAIPAGTTTTFTIYDDDKYMPNTMPGVLLPLDEHTLQIARLVPWSVLELAMDGGTRRTMIWEADDLALYVRNRAILFDNMGTA